MLGAAGVAWCGRLSLFLAVRQFRQSYISDVFCLGNFLLAECGIATSVMGFVWVTATRLQSVERQSVAGVAECGRATRGIYDL